jgi:hypothetical protein
MASFFVRENAGEIGIQRASFRISKAITCNQVMAFCFL